MVSQLGCKLSQKTRHHLKPALPTKHSPSLYLHLYVFVGYWNGVLSAVLQKVPCCVTSHLLQLQTPRPQYRSAMYVVVCLFLSCSGLFIFEINFFPYSYGIHLLFICGYTYTFVGCWNGVLNTVLQKGPCCRCSSSAPLHSHLLRPYASVVVNYGELYICGMWGSISEPMPLEYSTHSHFKVFLDSNK